jgi:hypothetical protein
LIHGALEVFILYIESYQFELSLSKYFIICFNGRLGWVPFLDKMKNSDKMHELVAKDKAMDYDQVQTNFCGMSINTEFLFSDQTAETLAMNIYKMKTILDEKDQPKLKIGKCMKYVNLESIMKILDFSTLKINVLYSEVPVKQMMLDSPNFIQKLQD